MKDRIYLLLTGIICAIGAWLFFYTTGMYAFVFMAAGSLVVLFSSFIKKRKK